MPATKESPEAAQELMASIGGGLSPTSMEADDLQGATDCPDGCEVEPDGVCPHGYLSAARTLGII